MFAITAKAIFQLFVLILVGIFAYKIKLVKKEGIDTLNNIILDIALPLLLFKSFQMDVLFENKGLIASALFYTLLFQVVALALAFLFIRKGEDRGVERGSIAFTNNAFIAIPLLTTIFGTMGTFYACAANVISNLLLWSVLPMLMTGEFSWKTLVKKSFNDKIIACIIAMILLFFDIKMPEIIMTPIGYLADLTTPLAMISVGALIAQADIKQVFSGRVVYISFLRLIVSTLIVCMLYRFLVADMTARLCFCVLAATPTGTMCTVLGAQCGANTSKSSGIYLLTTVASAVTIPLIVLLMSNI